MSDDQYGDHEERRRAETELRKAIAAEKQTERAMRAKIQKGFYGCLALFVVVFLLLMFFTGR